MPDPTITTLPAAPAPTDDRATFSAKSFNFFAALATFITEVNAIVVWIAAQVTGIASNAATALAARLDAIAAATAASMHANATKWVSGTAYADGQIVWSPTTYLTYRRMGAGAGATDPAADTVNWLLVDRSPVGALLPVSASVTAVPFATYAMPSAGAYIVTLPPTPAPGDWVGFVPPGAAVTGQKVARNGKNIMDKAEDMDIDVDTLPFRLVYLNTTRGWVMTA
ncbi:hypothetical protein [Acidovorax sp. Root568]|uniref:hypothetical protein n=1 Tax=Acidovorax sp. Root568 TaxID=1736565 RepID=UPI0006F37312|nr:hypothetical protein [Acidovorax sp. Root568]KRA13957.1 hypothetical protein ASD75_04655 [Acidovorax sp. Root568]